MAAVAPLEKPGAETARRAEPAVPVEPAGVQSLHAQGEPGKTLGLSLRRGHGQLSRKVDGSIAVAALTPISETRRDVNQAPGRHFELLSDQGSLRRSRGGEREYSHVDQSRPRLSESRLPAVEGQADGRDKRRIHRRSHPQESSLKWPICRILAQSRFCVHTETRLVAKSDRESIQQDDAYDAPRNPRSQQARADRPNSSILRGDQRGAGSVSLEVQDGRDYYCIDNKRTMI